MSRRKKIRKSYSLFVIQQIPVVYFWLLEEENPSVLLKTFPYIRWNLIIFHTYRNKNDIILSDTLKEITLYSKYFSHYPKQFCCHIQMGWNKWVLGYFMSITVEWGSNIFILFWEKMSIVIKEISYKVSYTRRAGRSPIWLTTVINDNSWIKWYLTRRI